MKYVEYIQASLAKGTIGAYISVGVFGLIALCAFFGVYHGVIRGFSKTVIRFFTVMASSVCALLSVMGISKLLVKAATGSAGGEAQSVKALLDSYAPGLTDSMPEIVQPLLEEINSGTATVFVMMILAVVLTPILFILFFYLFKFLTFFLYALLAGLAGAISYGRGVVSVLAGAVTGLLQGVFIAAVIIIPISGLCNVAVEAREPLIGGTEEPNAYLSMAYDTVIDDLADNPVFDLVDKFGGEAAYERMITVRIDGKTMDMGEECIGAVRVISDILPIAKGFDWKNPTDAQRQAMEDAVVDIGDNDLLASLISDIMRGVSRSITKGALDLGVSGAAKTLVNDIMEVFATSTNDTIEGDLDLVLDIYFIICDDHLFDSFNSSDPNALRDVLTKKDENGNTVIDSLLNRLNEYDRAQPIITSFTKFSLTIMQESLGFDDDTTELYESVKEDLTQVLNHNKSDFETEEEYKEQVSKDLDQTLQDNNLTVDEDVKQSMVDYIADNYGDHEGEITDKEINDALLSYYKSYADSLANGEEPNLDDILGGGTLPEGTLPEDTLPEGEGTGEGE